MSAETQDTQVYKPWLRRLLQLCAIGFMMMSQIALVPDIVKVTNRASMGYTSSKNGPVVTASDVKLLDAGQQALDEQVSLIVKHMSKYRTEHMAALALSIRRIYPNIRVIVGDDTPEYSGNNPPEWSKHPQTTLMALPPDCGLALGRNILVDAVTTPYFVLLDDDFIVTENTRLESMLQVLFDNPDVDIVGGGLTDDSKPGGDVVVVVCCMFVVSSCDCVIRLFIVWSANSSSKTWKSGSLLPDYCWTSKRMSPC